MVLIAETPRKYFEAAGSEASAVDPIVVPETRRRKGEIKKHRKRVGYENDVARCGNCCFYNPQWKGDTTIVKSWCKRHKFFCNTNACCDYWESASGETLKV